MSDSKCLSFFLPFYNEEKSLAPVVKTVISVASQLLTHWEIILVDDGSSDRSFDIACEMMSRCENIRIVRLEGNQGFGIAYLRGISEARFPFAMYLSTDGDVNEVELKQILFAWDGRRGLIQYAQNPQARFYYRYLLSRWFTRITNFLSGNNWPYYNGFNIYRLKEGAQIARLNFGFATQAYVVLNVFNSRSDVIRIATASKFFDQGSKALTIKNFIRATRFFWFVVRTRVAEVRRSKVTIHG